jgi:hypothetical protein
MTQRPELYRGFRLGDAALLAVAALAMTVAAPAGARERAAAGAGDPSASGRDLVFERLGGGSVLRRGGRERSLNGSDPAVGGSFIALRRGNQIVLLGRRSLRERARLTAPGTDALAVSPHWLVYRVREDGGDVIRAIHLGSGSGGIGVGGETLRTGAVVARAPAPAQLSRPSVFRATLVYARSTPGSSSIVHRVLGKRRKTTLIGSRRWLVSSPSILGRSFAYVRTTNERQQLRVRRLGRRGKGTVVFSMAATSFRDPDHEPGHHRLPTRVPKPDRRRSASAMWSTALAPDRVYLTLLRQKRGRVASRIIRVGR